jgi:hypothetical protein
MTRSMLLPILLAGLCCPRLFGDELQFDESRVRSAIQRGLTPILGAVERYPSHRKCFSCHHQTLPMLTIEAVREAGIEGDFDQPFRDSWELTQRAFDNRIKTLQLGGRIGGDSATVSHALWTAEISGTRGTELTEALLAYLVKRQHEHGYWKPQSDRPPLEGSELSTTVLVVNLMEAQEDEPAREAAIRRGREWLATAEPEDQQDRAFLYWFLRETAEESPDHERSRRWLDVIREKQRPDGGWSQLDREESESDAYATGQTLYFLLDGGVSRNDPMIRRGVAFLLNSQHEDGSWFVQTRSKPVQPWYDNGDPHGKSQFISTPASCWAVAALAKSLAPQ